MKPPKKESDIPTWRRLVSSKFETPVDLAQYVTGSLPTLSSTERVIAWDTTLNKPVAWNGTSWTALY